MANEQNLISLSERTTGERREIAKKGGIKSGEVRRERKKLKDELLLLLSEGNVQSKMCLAMIKQAIKGNTKAFEIVRDTIGEKSEKIEFSGNIDVNSPYDELSVEELRVLARKCEEDGDT